MPADKDCGSSILGSKSKVVQSEGNYELGNKATESSDNGCNNAADERRGHKKVKKDWGGQTESG